MAILRAAATANFTLDNTGTPTLITGLTLTPASGDYLLFASCEVDPVDPGGGGDLNEFSVFVGGTQIAASIRQIQEEGSLNTGTITIALNATVSPNGSQAVEIRHVTSLSTDPSTAQRRELTLFPMPVAGTNSEDSATATDTLATATFTTLDSMSRTPPADDYYLLFSTDAEGPADVDMAFRVSVGGTHLQHTHRQFANENSLPNTTRPMMIACKVSPNGSQVVEIEWSRVDGTGTITAHARTMNLVPVDAADIVEATGTADDARTASGEILIDDMTIVDPGADDWLVNYSSYDLGGTVGNNPITVMIHEGGTKVTDSDRRNDHDDSEDDTHLPILAGGRVTIGGATDDLEMFWTLLPGGGPTFTMKERTLVAMREKVVGAITATAALAITATADLKDVAGGLSASPSLAFSLGADLTAKGQLAATPNLAFALAADLQDGAAPDIWYKTGQFVTPASGTTVIDVTDKGTNPFAIHVWFSRVTADDTVQADQLFGHGFSDGTNHDTGMTNAQDGANNTNRDGRNANLILIKNPTDDSDDVLAAGAAMNVNDITISYTTFTTGYRIHFEIWGGADGSAEMREVAASTSPINDLTMVTPDMVLAWTLGQQHPATSIHGYMSFGVAVDNAGIDQWAQFTYMGDNDTDFVGSALVAGQFAGQYDVDFADWQIQVTAIGSNGVTWAGTNGDEVLFLFLDLAGIQVEVNTFAKSTATAPATQALPDLGFTPMGYLLATCNFDLQTLNTDRIVHASMGAYDGVTGHSALAVGTAQSNADRASQSHASEVLQGSDALQANGVEFSATPQAITDSTPDVEWDPNTTGATDDVVIGLYAFEAQEVAVSPITATPDLAITAAADLRAIGQLDGSPDLVFALAAQLDGLGEVSATPDLIFALAAQLDGRGELTATPALVFALAAQLDGLGALAATPDLVFALAAQLDGLGALSATPDLVFALAAALEDVAAMTATPDLVFALAADLNGVGELTATPDLVFALAAQLDGLGELSATPDLVFALAAQLDGLGELSATPDLVFALAADLAGLEGIAATPDLVFALAADLNGIGELSATPDLIFALAADLNGIGELAATPDLVFALAADLLGLGALTATPDLVFALAADLVGLGELSASPDLIFALAADLNGIGELTATPDLVFALTADLAGKEGIAATPDLVFALTADLNAIGALAATPDLVFALAADLAGIEGISATPDLVFALAADLNGVGELTATPDLIFALTADLVGLGELAATPDLVFALAADLVGLGALSATPDLIFALAAELLARGELTASPDLVFDVVADISDVQQMTASPDLAFALTAALDGLGELSATPDLVFALAAALDGLGELTATPDLVFALAADLNGVGELTATPDLVFALAAGLDGLGELAATPDLVFALTADLEQSGELIASPDLFFALAADLNGVGELTATPDLAFALTADLKGLAALSATPALVFDLAADLDGLSALSAAPDMAFALAADLNGVGQLSASALMTFDILADIRNATPVSTFTSRHIQPFIN